MKYRFDIAIGTTDALPLEQYVFHSFAGPLLHGAASTVGDSLAEVSEDWAHHLPRGASVDAVAAWQTDDVTFGSGTTFQLMLASWRASSATRTAPGLDDLLVSSNLPPSADRVVSVGSWIGVTSALSVVLPVAAQVVAAHPSAAGWMGHPSESIYASEGWRPFGPDRGPFGAVRPRGGDER
ncbi:MAG: hypothetical protein AAGA90_08765 [Actinomycetota bacterium]